MKRGIQALLASAFFLVLVLPVSAQPDVRKAPACKYCGMYRSVFASSRMLIERTDEAPVGTCSLNCAAIDYMRSLDDLPKAIKVADYRTRRLIDAKTAYWVMGGDKPGVMTQRAKWAFEKKSDAAAFIRRHGGEPATFEEAIRASYEDIYKDMKLSDRHKYFQHARAHF